MSDECLKKLPPIIITTGEYDIFRRSHIELIERLQKACRLLDVLDVPQSVHGYENTVNTVNSMNSEIETIRIWNRFVLDQKPLITPAHSKDLFLNKYKYQGKIDEDQSEAYQGMLDQALSPEYAGLAMTVENAHQTVPEYKEMCKMVLGEEGKNEALQKAVEECETEEIIVPVGYGNIIPVRMLVHTPKSLKGQKGLIPYFELHQGGAIGGEPDLNIPFCCYYAVTLGCVVFNPMYILAGTKYGASDAMS